MTAFDPSLEDLQDTLPASWAAKDPTSQLYLLLTAIASMVDDLAMVSDQFVSDQHLATASDEALRFEWAVLYGAGNEQLPVDTETLRAYLIARAAEDGSAASLERTLLALLDNDANNAGTQLTFPADGSGLTFPADGSGLTMFQTSYAAANRLTFPADGSGLIFPADGSGLIFPSGGRLEVVLFPADNRFDVYVRDFLSFDRPSFTRAVNRARDAHLFPPGIYETSTPVS